VSTYSLSHLSDGALLRDLSALVARDRATTAELLAHLAEVDARKLYRPAGYPSMYAWCVGELKLCEQAALKRITAARAARRFPAIFERVAEGRLHLSAVTLLAPHLTEDNAAELLVAATHKSKPEIELLLARRFPTPDLPTSIQALAPTPDTLQLSPGRVDVSTEVDEATPSLSPGAAPVPRPRLTPLAPERYALQVTISENTHNMLCYAQELMGHQVRRGDVATVLERALDALFLKLEKQ
jgi:hypothetical protein